MYICRILLAIGSCKIYKIMLPFLIEEKKISILPFRQSKILVTHPCLGMSPKILCTPRHTPPQRLLYT